MAKRIIECQVNDEYVVGAGVPIGASGSHDDVILRLKFNDTWDGLYIYATFRDALGGHPTVVLLLPTMLVDGKARTYDVTIPAAAKLYNGKATVTLTGYLTKQEETESGIERTVEASVTNTATAYFPVLPSNYVVADDGSVDLNVAQRLQDEITRHEKNVSEELEGIRVGVDAQIEEHKTHVAQTLAAHEAKVAENLQAQDEEINGAVLTATEAERIAKEVQARADNGEFIGETGKQGEKGEPGVIKFIPVIELPTENIAEDAIYLVPSDSSGEENVFDEYIYVGGAWEKLSSAGVAVNLDEYVKKTDAANAGQIAEKTLTNRFLSPYYLDEIIRVGLTTNAKVLTDEEKAAAQSWLGVDERFGDVESVLDSIIAIQNSLIGGESE